MKTRAALVAILLLALGACTTVDRLNAPALAGAPASSALLLVRVEATARDLRGTESQQIVQGGALQRLGGSEFIEGKAAAGYVVFSDLAPGAYRLVTLRTTFADGAATLAHLYTLPQDASRGYDVELRAGEPCFLGLITIRDVQTRHERGTEFELHDRAQVEPQAWRWFARVYASSPWAAAARAPSATCTRR